MFPDPGPRVQEGLGCVPAVYGVLYHYPSSILEFQSGELKGSFRPPAVGLSTPKPSYSVRYTGLPLVRVTIHPPYQLIIMSFFSCMGGAMWNTSEYQLPLVPLLEACD